MTFKGYIRRVYVLHIESKIHTEPLIQYVCSRIKYPFTCPFFGWGPQNIFYLSFVFARKPTSKTP